MFIITVQVDFGEEIKMTCIELTFLVLDAGEFVKGDNLQNRCQSFNLLNRVVLLFISICNEVVSQIFFSIYYLSKSLYDYNTLCVFKMVDDKILLGQIFLESVL